MFFKQHHNGKFCNASPVTVQNRGNAIAHAITSITLKNAMHIYNKITSLKLVYQTCLTET